MSQNRAVSEEEAIRRERAAFKAGSIWQYGWFDEYRRRHTTSANAQSNIEAEAEARRRYPLTKRRRIAIASDSLFAEITDSGLIRILPSLGSDTGYVIDPDDLDALRDLADRPSERVNE